MKREELAYQAAVMYYVNEETMSAIAHHLDVSRSTVSRLLRDARELGLVQIVLSPPQDAPSHEARELNRRFGVQAHIVPVPASANSIRSSQAVAGVAGVLVSTLVEDHSSIGVAWGNTLSSLGAYLVPKRTSDSTVVQLNGAVNSRNVSLPYAGSIMDCFVESFGCTPVHYPVPAFFDHPETRTAMWRESSVQAVRDLQKRCDVAIFGVGTMHGTNVSHVYTGGFFDNDELEDLDAAGVVGDICTVMMRADGTWQDLAINQRASGPTPDDLANISRRVCVVSDESKVTATLAALRAGVATDLVLSNKSAEAILARLNPRQP